jgi:eukaryotic-like serine/threonine-protein kinase
MPAESQQGADPLVGRLLAGKFRVERALGQGAMGKVYLAEQTNLGKQVALKVLHANMTGDPSLEKRFQREARAASMLSHPNIVHTVDFGNDGGLLFIAMELLGGRDLRQAMREEWPFGPERIAHIVGQILSALDEAHSKGLVHRDLKPENVMLVDVRGEPDFVKVCDFGIAKVQSERDGDGSAITTAGMVCGTPEYMSPEQGRGDPLDGRSDLYSVAVILYHLVAGELPFRAESALGVVTKHLMEPPTPPSKKRPGAQVLPALEAVIMRGLEKNREKRFESADEMKGALYEACGLPRPRSSSSQPAFPKRDQSDAALAATGVSGPAAMGSARTQRATGGSGGTMAGELARRPTSGRAAWLLGAVIVSVVLAAGGYVLFRGKPKPPEPDLVYAQNDSPRAAASSSSVAAMAPRSEVGSAPGGAATAKGASPSSAAVVAAAETKTTSDAKAADAKAAKTDAPVAVASADDKHHHAHHAKPAATSAKTSLASAHPAAAAAPGSQSAATAPLAAAPAKPAPHTFAGAYAEGDALFKGGDVSGALARYEEAARLNPQDARTQRQIGKCYTRLGQRDRATPHFRKYLELAPDAADAPFIRALVEGSN